jgi:prepilin-type N-terminal cleavage/methylation domain-containing protein
VRAGFSLHELLISLTILSAVMGLAAHAATRHARLFRGIDELAAARDHATHTSAIAERILWGVAPAAGDLIAAHDTALEVRIAIGSAVVCDGWPGRFVIPAPPATEGHTLASFLDEPQAGDRIAALFSDSLGSTWLTLHVTASPVADVCARFAGISAAWSVVTNEQLVVPSGAILRFSRPLRLAMYRASDSRWYLGAREWNADEQTFHTIQPVVGPLRPPSADESHTGLLIVYRDAAGARLIPPFEPSHVASVSIVTRTQTATPIRIEGMSGFGALRADSSTVTIALRNAR